MKKRIKNRKAPSFKDKIFPLLKCKLIFQVERITVDGWSIVLSIERTCTSECLYGCRYNGYGVTYERCYSCCRTKNCNTDNGAPCSGLHSPLLAVFNTLAIIVLNNAPIFSTGRRLNFQDNIQQPVLLLFIFHGI